MIASWYLIPAKGLLVRDPITLEPLPEAGATKPKNRFWRRRVRDGDAAEGKAPKATAKLGRVTKPAQKGDA